MISHKVFEGVLECILRSKKTTREEIANKIGYSSATVGKAVNWLLDAGIVEQKMVSLGGAGRKTGILELCADKKFGVINLSCRRFEFSILNTRLSLLGNISRTIDGSLEPLDELRIFLNDIRLFCGDELKELTFGVVLPSSSRRSNATEQYLVDLDWTDEEINLLTYDILGTENINIFSMDDALRVAIGKHPQLCPSNRVFYLGLSDYVSSLFVDNGEAVQGISAAHSLIAENTLQAGLFGDGAYEDATKKIASVLANIMTLCAPDIVLLDSKLTRISNEVYDKALEMCAPFVPISRLWVNKNAPFIDDIGAAIFMRDAYIMQKIEKINAHRKQSNYDFDY